MRKAYHVKWKYQDERRISEKTVYARDERDAIAQFAASPREQIVSIYQR